MKNLFKRRAWTEDEDAAIMHLVDIYDHKNWGMIADRLSKEFNINGRTGKQCRERWYNHLDPKVLKSSWSELE